MKIHDHPILDRIYRNRGLTDPKRIDYALRHLIPPDSLPHLDEAVEIIAESIVTQKHIVVAGDYDADGATGAAVGYRGLRLLGANKVMTIVPDRSIDGYGLTMSLIDKMSKLVDVIITVDSGTASLEGVAYAQGLGIKVVVTDHHLPGDNLPNCPIVNPNLYSTNTPLNHTCGAGVMFYVLCAVRRQLRLNGYYRDKLPELESLLPLVAVGTIADLMVLNDNNRRLIKHGLTKIQCDVMPKGLRELISKSGKDAKTITATDIAFSIAPVINAAGRIDNMEIGVEALISEDIGRVDRLVKQLRQVNQTRKEQQATMVDEAKAIVESTPIGDQDGIVVYQDSWHPGIVGLVASQIKNKYNKPVFAFAPAIQGSSELRGSGRSVAGIHIRDALAEIDVKNPGLLGKYGGHAMAAGMSLDIDKLEEFRVAFNSYLKAHPDLVTPPDIDDGELKPEEINLSTIEMIDKAGPWGNGFPEPQFHGRFKVLSTKILKDKYLKLTLDLDGINDIEALWFDWDLSDPNHKEVDISYTLSVNTFSKVTKAQLMVKKLAWVN